MELHGDGGDDVGVEMMRPEVGWSREVQTGSTFPGADLP